MNVLGVSGGVCVRVAIGTSAVSTVTATGEEVDNWAASRARRIPAIMRKATSRQTIPMKILIRRKPITRIQSCVWQRKSPESEGCLP